MTVDSTLLEAGRLHQVIEGAALVPSLIENRRGRLHDLFPGLLAFGHKVAFAPETGRSFPIIALQFAWMRIGTEWSQTEHHPRNPHAICDRSVSLASNLAERPEAPEMANNNQRELKALRLAFCVVFSLGAWGQPQSPLGYSVATPRPINPAEGTTTPSAQATQRQNPYLGSVPSKNTGTRIELSLRSAIERGLRYNLGLVEANQTSAGVRAERLRALAALLPQLAAEGRQGYENLSYKEIGLKLPPIAGLPALPSTSGGFGYQDARVNLTQSLYNAELRNQYRARKRDEQA